jgi:hypothetical protein
MATTREEGLVITFELPLRLTSVNTYMGEHQRHKRTSEKKSIMVLLILLAPKGVKPPDHKQTVTLTRVLGRNEKLMDRANLYGGNSKQLIDCMTELGFWHDDSDKWLDLKIIQDTEHRDDGNKVIVTVEDA